MHAKKRFDFSRITILAFILYGLFFIVFIRLFYLQVIKHSYFTKIANRQHQGYTELPARRGEVLIRDYNSNDTFRLATNMTLDLVFADPTLIKDPDLVTAKLKPILFDIEKERAKDQDRIKEELFKAETEEEQEEIKPLSDEELALNYHNELLSQLKKVKRNYVLLVEGPDEATIEKISQYKLPGVYINPKQFYANPYEIVDIDETASILAPFIEVSRQRMRDILKGKNRYEVLDRKITPEQTEELKKLISNDYSGNYLGIGLKEEYYRFYPEHTLAAQLLGYVGSNGIGLYGIEGRYNTQLSGKKGIFTSQKDGVGQQITVGDSTIQAAVDGDNIYLTIDRAVQLEVEKKLSAAVKNLKADSGQAVVMNPQTGQIIAMAHAPTFDPNDYGKVFKRRRIELSDKEIENLVDLIEGGSKHTYLILNSLTHEKLEVFPKKDENSEPYYEIYENRVGPAVYRNNSVSGTYEPGSVFKVIAMSAALDDNDVTPQTRHPYSGPIQVDEFEIHNAEEKYTTNETMTQVLENSSNVGMAFVAQTIGRSLFYNYIINFGFGTRSDIEFENEHPGKIEYYTKWAESELVTHAFGQGLTATPIQMATAVSAIANGGLLMQPYIVDIIEHDSGKQEKTEPQIIRRVIAQETADTMTAMLTSAVTNGVANRAQVNGHYVAGKTGTSQTYRHGKPLSGAGTTITSFAGYGPINDPKFVVLIKLDRPRVSPWGASTAAPLFSEIATFLFDYYNIPPDK